MFMLLSILLTGLSLCCAVWVVIRPAVAARARAPAPKAGSAVRLVWPWVCALAPVCEPFVGWRMRARLIRMISLAGLDGGWTAAHVAACQSLAFLAVAGSMILLGRDFMGMGWQNSLLLALAGGLAASFWPWQAIGSLGRQRQRDMLRELPFLLDMTVLCVEAGLNLHGALQQAARYGPAGPLRSELRHMLIDMQAGLSRQEALEQLARRTGLPAVRQLVAALTQADRMGANLGPMLRAQADQRRAERFLRAEQAALQAPVKMLFPMVTCIFPCTFLIIGFPVVLQILEGLA